MGEQDRYSSTLCIIKKNPKTKHNKTLKPNHQFNCNFGIIVGVSDVEMERDHSWIGF